LGEGDFIIVGRNKNTTPQSAACEFLREVRFSIGRDGPELYLKMFGRLGLYISTQLKNGSNIKKCEGEGICWKIRKSWENKKRLKRQLRWRHEP